MKGTGDSLGRLMSVFWCMELGLISLKSNALSRGLSVSLGWFWAVFQLTGRCVFLFY